MLFYVRTIWRYVSAIPAMLRAGWMYKDQSSYSRGRLRDMIDHQAGIWNDMLLAMNLYERQRLTRRYHDQKLREMKRRRQFR